MITNIYIGSDLFVEDIATFNSGILSNNITISSNSFTNMITTEQIELYTNASNFNIGAPYEDFYIYNGNINSNAIEINYSTNQVTIGTLTINSNYTINITNTTYGFQIIGNSGTNEHTQLSFYNTSTLTWIMGPNYTVGSDNGIGINDFLLFNVNAKIQTNTIIFHYDIQSVSINANVNESDSLIATSLNAQILSIASANVSTLAVMNAVTAQQLIVAPTIQQSGIHVYGDIDYSAEIAFSNDTGKLWEMGTTTTNITGSGNFFFIYNNQESYFPLTIETTSPPTFNFNTAFYTPNNVTITSDAYVNNIYVNGTGSIINQLLVEPNNTIQGLSIIGSDTSNSATQIFFYGNTSSTEPIVTYWQLGPNFISVDDGNFYLLNDIIGVNMIEITSSGDEINFYGSPTQVMTMTVNGDLVVANSISFNTLNIYDVTVPVQTFQYSALNDANTTGTAYYSILGNLVIYYLGPITWTVGTYGDAVISTPFLVNGRLYQPCLINANSSYFFESIVLGTGTDIYIKTLNINSGTIVTFPPQFITYFTT